jgi:hypothetical protein
MGLNVSKEEEEAKVIVFPNERLGLNYRLNHVLNRNHRLTPRYDAFRNVHLRHLIMHANGKPGTTHLADFYACHV